MTGVQTCALPISCVLALGLPLIFLHVDWQPKLRLTVGSTSGDLDLSDFAVLAAGLAGLAAGLAHGFWPLRAGRWIPTVKEASLR